MRLWLEEHIRRVCFLGVEPTTLEKSLWLEAPKTSHELGGEFLLVSYLQ